MESIIEIPEDQKYVICLLDSQGKPVKYVLFNGNSQPITNDQIKQKLFSDDELKTFNSLPQPEFHSSSQQIHKDDTIRTIKKKIIHELGKNELCYEEIYLFSQQQQPVDPIKILTQQKGLFTGKLFSQLAINIQMDNTLYSDFKKLNKVSYSYEDLKKYINKESMYKVSVPLGQRFSRSRDLLFSGNPFDVEMQKDDPEPAFVVSNENELYTFENQLLLNYGEIINNVIYVCRAGDVCDYAVSAEYSYQDGSKVEKVPIDLSYMIQLYFPLLYKLNINSKDEFNEKQQELISQNNYILKPSTFQLYDTIDLLYNIYNSRKSEIPYSEKGVLSFDIVLHPDIEIALPLDIIFKQIHATKGTTEPFFYPFVPLIKYNPGKKRDAIFRFYSESISKDGKKIPWLKKKQISTISRENKKNNQILLYIQYSTLKNEKIDIFLEIESNGNMRVRSILNKPISMNKLENIIYNVTNPIIIKLNKILEKSGYKIKRFNSLKDENVEIVKLKYNLMLVANKTINFRRIIGCLTSIFDVADTDLDSSKGIILNFIRVSNYQKMNAISSMITEVFKRSNSKSDIVNALIVNFSLSKEEALQEIVKYFNQHQRIHGEYVNKQLDVVDNPGFPVSIYKSPFDNKLDVRIDQINSIEFIDIMNIYIDAIIRMLLYPQDIPEHLNEGISSLCSRIGAVEEDVKLDNIILKNPVVAPVILEEAVLEDEDDEEDEEDRYLPDEEDEDEDEEENNIVSNILEEPSEENKEELSQENEEEEGYLPEEDDEEEEEGYLPEEDEEENSGGAKGERDVKTNMFTKRMMEKEPNLILKKTQGKFVSYSRVCPANASLQPIILTDEEKKEIDKDHSGAYTNAIKYGSDPKKQFWYICPRFWCTKTNKPMTEEEVKRGDCGGKVVQANTKNPPEDHFIFEFTDDKYHKDETGKYIWHSPGFKPEHSHPDSKMCVPCCYNNWASKSKALSQQQTRRQQCGLVDVNTNRTGPDGKKSQESYQTVPDEKVASEAVLLTKPKEDIDLKKEKERKKQEGKINIFGIERTPVPQYRWGFLPIAVERFLNTKNNKFVIKSNPSYIQEGKRPLLRYGVEESPNQSFIGVIADVYSDYHEEKLLSIEGMREKIAQILTLDDYLKLHNGSLTSIFKPSKIQIDDVNVEDYKNTYFYKHIDLYDPSQYSFLKDSISSFQNFQNYLKDPDSIIDHTYLWDIISSEESLLFEGGLNMVIIEIMHNDITDNIDLLCPTSAYSTNIYKKNRGTILILKHDVYYEPIYLYSNSKKDSEKPIRIFTDVARTEELKTIKQIFTKIIGLSDKKCKPLKTRPGEYQYKENISARLLHDNIIEMGLAIESQVMNYNGKIIALIAKTKENKKVYLPCFPSGQLPNIELKIMNANEWSDYVTTKDLLEKISVESNGKILCKPMMKVIEDGLIVGILTITNQFVQINEPIQDIYENDLPICYGVGYNKGRLDSVLSTSKNQDDTRVNSVKNIKLETQFYLSFRTEIRNMLNNYNYREIREQIILAIDNPKYLYTVKMKKVDILLRHLTRNLFSFVEDINVDIKNNILELSEGNLKSFCLQKYGKTCFPRVNLISGETNNEEFYFARISDELIRNKRIRTFMLDDKKYLNISNVDYSVNEDEVILLNSILTDEYFEDMVPFQNNKYVQRISYDVANPSKNTGFYQNFSNEVPLTEQV